MSVSNPLDVFKGRIVGVQSSEDLTPRGGKSAFGEFVGIANQLIVLRLADGNHSAFPVDVINKLYEATVGELARYNEIKAQKAAANGAKQSDRYVNGSAE